MHDFFTRNHGLKSLARDDILKRVAHFVDSQNSKVDEELKELDECHDGEAEPQTKNTARVRDVLQQLKHTYSISEHLRLAVKTAGPYLRSLAQNNLSKCIGLTAVIY